MAAKPRIYLASRSPRRRVILKRFGYRVKVIASRYKEEGSGAPARLVLRHAVGKVRGASFPRGKGIVVGADTIVYLKGRIYGKPRDMKDAKRMIRALNGRTHAVYTGVAVLDLSTKRIVSGYDKARVRFNRLSDEQIDRYLARIRPLDKAGAYAVQRGKPLVAEITGSFTNIMGLPIELVRRLLRQAARR